MIVTNKPFMLNVITLNVIMLNVIMLNVITLIVVAPHFFLWIGLFHYNDLS